MRSSEDLYHYEDCDLLQELSDRGLSFSDVVKEWHENFGNDSTEIRDLVESGLAFDGGHHKQYYLVQLANELGFEFDFEYEEGIPA